MFPSIGHPPGACCAAVSSQRLPRYSPVYGETSGDQQTKVVTPTGFAVNCLAGGHLLLATIVALEQTDRPIIVCPGGPLHSLQLCRPHRLITASETLLRRFLFAPHFPHEGSGLFLELPGKLKGLLLRLGVAEVHG